MAIIDAIKGSLDRKLVSNPELIKQGNIATKKAPTWLKACVHQNYLNSWDEYSKLTLVHIGSLINAQLIQCVRIQANSTPFKNAENTLNQSILDNLPDDIRGIFDPQNGGDIMPNIGGVDGYISWGEIADEQFLTMGVDSIYDSRQAVLEVGDNSWHKILLWSISPTITPYARFPYGYDEIFIFFKTRKWLSSYRDPFLDSSFKTISNSNQLPLF